MAAVGLTYWSGPATAFAVAAIAFARMQEHQVDLRRMLLGRTLFRSVHDALVGSWMALSADLATGVLGLSALLAMSRQPAAGLGHAVPARSKLPTAGAQAPAPPSQIGPAGGIAAGLRRNA